MKRKGIVSNIWWLALISFVAYPIPGLLTAVSTKEPVMRAGMLLCSLLLLVHWCLLAADVFCLAYTVIRKGEEHKRDAVRRAVPLIIALIITLISADKAVYLKMPAMAAEGIVQAVSGRIP